MYLSLVCNAMTFDEPIYRISFKNTRQHVKKQRFYFAEKSPCSQIYGFYSSHVWMWQLDCKEGWMLKNWCFQIVMLEKTLESPLDCKEIQSVHPKGDQSWIFTGRTDVEAPLIWPLDEKSWLIRKDPDAGKDWGQEEKRVTEDEMVGWHHQLNGQEFGQTLGDSEVYGSLVCCSPRGCKESDTTEWLNNNHISDIIERFQHPRKLFCVPYSHTHPKGTTLLIPITIPEFWQF